METRILLLFAHPALHKSRANARLLREAEALDGVTVHDLYEEYPDFVIHVDREQALLSSHDLVVAQHPFYWYSTPAILKEWQDLVLEYGWAYGEGGDALAGKQWLSVITTGGARESYRTGAHNRWTMRQLLAPLDQTVHLCGMEYLPPFVVQGAGRMDSTALDRVAGEYRDALAGLRDGAVDLDALRQRDYFNRDADDKTDWRPRDARIGGTTSAR